MIFYNIIETFNNYQMLYRDPFTGKTFKDTKQKANMIAFMLTDQAKKGYVYELKEVEN